MWSLFHLKYVSKGTSNNSVLGFEGVISASNDVDNIYLKLLKPQQLRHNYT